MKKTMKAVARVLAGAVIATALFATSASAHEARECIVFDARSGMIVDMLRASTDCSCAKPDYRNYAKIPIHIALTITEPSLSKPARSAVGSTNSKQ